MKKGTKITQVLQVYQQTADLLNVKDPETQNPWNARDVADFCWNTEADILEISPREIASQMLEIYVAKEA